MIHKIPMVYQIESTDGLAACLATILETSIKDVKEKFKQTFPDEELNTCSTDIIINFLSMQDICPLRLLVQGLTYFNYPSDTIVLLFCVSPITPFMTYSVLLNGETSETSKIFDPCKESIFHGINLIETPITITEAIVIHSFNKIQIEP